MSDPVDDMGYAVRIPDGPPRIVSLVPSLTEALAVTRGEALVGATDWCTHPTHLDVRRVRGTKNPDLRAIVDVQPTLVIANREENRRIDVERLRAHGIAVWVTDIRSVDDGLASLDRLFTVALRWGRPDWLDEAVAAWSAPAPVERRTVAVAVWRDPWMVVGRDTFAGDLLARCGADNVFADATERYPHTTAAEIRAAEADVVVLPDEPYPFTSADGPEEFPGRRVALLSGRALTWYGPSLTTARADVTEALAGARKIL